MSLKYDKAIDFQIRQAQYFRTAAARQALTATMGSYQYSDYPVFHPQHHNLFIKAFRNGMRQVRTQQAPASEHPRIAKIACDNIANAFVDAETFVVHSDVAQTVSNIPPKARTIKEHQLFVDTGFIWFDAPLPANKGDQGITLYEGILWERQGDLIQGLVVEDNFNNRVYTPWAFPIDSDIPLFMRNVIGPLFINGLLGFMSQYVVTMSSVRPDRDTRRKMKKHLDRPDPADQEYNVIYLRRSYRKDDDLTEAVSSGRTLKNQHVVRSHWKRYHTREGVEWRKVREHLRGPDGTKLIESKRVFHVKR